MVAFVSVMGSKVTFLEKSNWYGLHSGGWRVGAGVVAELPPQTEIYTAQVVQVGVVDPHAGEDMSHVSRIAFNGVLAGGSSS